MYYPGAWVQPLDKTGKTLGPRASPCTQHPAPSTRGTCPSEGLPCPGSPSRGAAVSRRGDGGSAKAGGSFHPGSAFPMRNNVGTRGGDGDRLTCTPGSLSRWVTGSFSASSSTVWMEPGETLCGRQGTVTTAKPRAQPSGHPHDAAAPFPEWAEAGELIAEEEAPALTGVGSGTGSLGPQPHPDRQLPGSKDPREEPHEQTPLLAPATLHRTGSTGAGTGRIGPAAPKP